MSFTDEKPDKKSGDKRKRVSIVGNLVRTDSGTQHTLHDPLPGDVDPNEFYYNYDTDTEINCLVCDTCCDKNNDYILLKK